MSSIFIFLTILGFALQCGMAIAGTLGVADPASLAGLKSTAASSGVASARIEALPYWATPFAPIKPKDFERQAAITCDVAIDSSESQDLIRAIEMLVGKEVKERSDWSVYWSLSLRDERDTALSTIYLGRTFANTNTVEAWIGAATLEVSNDLTKLLEQRFSPDSLPPTRCWVRPWAYTRHP